MKKGLLGNIYRSGYNCTLNKCYYEKSVIVVGPGVPEIFKPSDSDIVCELKTKNVGGLYTYLEPIDPPHNETDYMSGGTFVYNSDSRWPTGLPIPLHDRSESWETYDRLTK